MYRVYKSQDTETTATNNPAVRRPDTITHLPQHQWPRRPRRQAYLRDVCGTHHVARGDYLLTCYYVADCPHALECLVRVSISILPRYLYYDTPLVHKSVYVRHAISDVSETSCRMRSSDQALGLRGRSSVYTTDGYSKLRGRVNKYTRSV